MASAEEENEKQYGYIVWFKNEKGYGFIRPEESSSDEEVFVHWTQIDMEGYKTLQAGARVCFEIGGRNHRGPMASAVREVSETEGLSNEAEEG